MKATLTSDFVCIFILIIVFTALFIIIALMNTTLNCVLFILCIC